MQKQALENVYERELIIERIHLRGILDNIKILTRFKTPIPSERLQEAVKKLSITHPLLASRVILDEEGRSRFTTEHVPDIPVKIYKKNQPESYKEILYKEDCDLINTETGPLSRVILIDHPENPDLILYSHHVACDGLSLLYVTKHLLEYLSEPEKKAKQIEPIPYSDELLRRYPPNIIKKFMINRVNSDWSKRRRIFTEEEYQELQKDSQRDKILHISFTDEETKVLRDRSRQEGVTVNSALVTAMLSASTATPELKRSDEVAFTVNIRNMLESSPGEACGMYASGVAFSLKYRDTGNFWDNARKAHRIGREKLNNPDELFGRRTSSIILDPTIYDALIFATFSDFEDKLIERFKDKIAKPNLGGILTNLGGVTIPKEYGPMQVSDVVFIPPASGGGILAIGAGSIMGKLDIVIPYREPAFKEEVALKFSEEFKNILHEVIYDDVAIT